MTVRHKNGMMEICSIIPPTLAQTTRGLFQRPNPSFVIGHQLVKQIHNSLAAKGAEDDAGD